MEIRRKSALILGATGQDGWYLTMELHERGFDVFAVGRSRVWRSELQILRPNKLTYVSGDIADLDFMEKLLEKSQPGFVFNLAGFSHVGGSWENRALSRRTNFEAVRTVATALSRYREKHGFSPKLYHASSSEIFGGTQQSPQNELTPLDPVTPYGQDKADAHLFLRAKREGERLDIVAGIMYNHESPRRPMSFLSRKVTHAVASISLGLSGGLELGNMSAKRDWGFAGDYVRGICEVTFHGVETEYVIASGRAHSVQDFVEAAFLVVGIEDWQNYVTSSPEMTRRKDPTNLVGDPSRIHGELGWRARTSFSELITMMVHADIKRLSSKA
jgi:GDPmannose 4,6-dehydratase